MRAARSENRGEFLLERIEILDAGSEGMGVGRAGELVVFVPFVVPGDIVDVRVIRRKKNFLEGRAVKIHQYSPLRSEPFCAHFGLCGGCRWQNLTYAEQLKYKQKQVTDSLVRIGHLERPNILPILSSPETTNYRNKLEFTFSNRRWLSSGEADPGKGPLNTNGLGFHIPQHFDRIVDVTKCYLQPDPSNEIRMTLRAYAFDQGLTFYDARKLTGFLRNLIIRTSRNGGVMVILVVHDPDDAKIRGMLDHLLAQIPSVTSVYYVVNPKANDSLYDLPYIHYAGEKYLTETMLPFRPGQKEVLFRIGPASFFQTNSTQAANLYSIAAGFASPEGHETLYDLYTGTGTIANYIAPYVRNVVGIETVADAVTDAEENARLNGNDNVKFFAGEVEKILTPEFLERQGSPHILITDPPRVGMHEKVVWAILATGPDRVVYVSCNPATQARDLALMADAYYLDRCQPVDMFPHTQHVENVALLMRRG